MFKEDDQYTIDPDELSDEELRKIVAMPCSDQVCQSPFAMPVSQASQANDAYSYDSTLSAATLHTVFAQRPSEWV